MGKNPFKLNQAGAFSPVVFSTDLRRIIDLPRSNRTPTPEDIKLLNDHCKTPQGTWTLRPRQAQAIIEAVDNGGLLGGLGVGEGKTLIAGLMPLFFKAVRPMLIVPASLVEKTIREFEALREHYVIQPVNVISYAKIQRPQGADYLIQQDPDLIIMDEAHKFKNPKAAGTKRFLRYLEVRREMEAPVTVVALTGTLTSVGLMDYWHLAKHTHGVSAMPIPAKFDEAVEWDQALGAGSSGRGEDTRRPFGALRHLCPDAELPTLTDVRRGFRDRLAATPGVVLSTEPSCDVPLVIKGWNPGVEPTPEVVEAFRLIREDGVTPGGDLITDALMANRIKAQVACGMWTVWDPPPPMEWMDARYEWHNFAKEVIQRTEKSKKPIDAPGHLAVLIDRGDFAAHDAERGARLLERWRAIRPSYTIDPKAIWIDDYVVAAAEQWAIENNGVVWCDFRAVGGQFKKIPYFGAGDDGIDSYSGPCAASIKAHGTGRNLQAWNKALVLSPPSSASAWQQLIGRHHRQGQEADVVEVHIALHTIDLYKSYKRALDRAQYIEETTGEPQRLLFAATDVISEDEIEVLQKNFDFLWIEG